jgi:hypothetical protein
MKVCIADLFTFDYNNITKRTDDSLYTRKIMLPIIIDHFIVESE